MKKIYIILILIGVWNLSYGQSGYFPINQGETMTFAYGSDFNQGNDKLKCKIEVLNTTQFLKGKEYYISKTSYGSEGNYTVLTESYFRVGDDGSILVMSEDNTNESVMITKAPKIGDTWSRKNGEITATVKVVDLGGTVKTPKEIYPNCLVLESIENGATLRSYFQENIGMVAITVVMGVSEKIMIYLINGE